MAKKHLILAPAKVAHRYKTTRMSLETWIIALNPDNPVARDLLQSLTEQHIDARIFPAVDGRRDMPALQGQERISQTLALVTRKAKLTSSEVGCYLSHYRLIRQAYDRGVDHVCIFEDDVVAEAGLGNLIRDICELDDNAHLVRLMSLRVRKRKVVKTLPSGHTLVRPLRGALGAQGYVLNRMGMKKILDHGTNIYMPIDKLYDSFFLFGLNCFSVEPHAIYELIHPTTVSKAGELAPTPLWAVAVWRVYKLYRSIRRYSYNLVRRRELTPASKPSTPQGRSERIK